MQVRRADPTDLPAIAAIAETAFWDAYEGILKPATIEAWLWAAYSPAALQQRWEDHPIFLVLDGNRTIAFTDVFIEDDHIIVSAICTDREHRRRGAATLLLSRVRLLALPLPVTADVALGNQLAERFYEANGFAPGETIQVTRFGQRVVERRWWLPAQLAVAP